MKFLKILLISATLIIIAAIRLPALKPVIEINGAGATFPYPLYERMFADYNRQTGVKVNYAAIGSGGGIRTLKEKTVDFGGTDAALEDQQIKETGEEILHIPISLGAVVITYNLPDHPPIKLDADAITDIYLGKIDKWNDVRLTQLNPNIKLPNLGIKVIYRSDGSGTTSIFSNYLTKVNTEWRERIGAGASLDWVSGVGAEGNNGVAALVQQTPGSIGYVELIYAMMNEIPYADIRNKAGNYIEPTLESVSLSAEIVFPDDMRISLTDTDSLYGYPISGFTWIIIYKEQYYNRRTKIIAEATINLIEWMIAEGQRHTLPLHYAPLPEAAVEKARLLLMSVTYKGEKL